MEAAEDATSLVFAKALAGLPSYRADGATFRSWLFTIAHNVVIDAPGASLGSMARLRTAGEAMPILVSHKRSGVV
jgi:hypothetical protein